MSIQRIPFWCVEGVSWLEITLPLGTDSQGLSMQLSMTMYACNVWGIISSRFLSCNFFTVVEARKVFERDGRVENYGGFDCHLVGFRISVAWIRAVNMSCRYVYS